MLRHINSLSPTQTWVTDISIVDRSDVLPSKDGSSNDFNRIVRTSYSDPFYSRLAREAIQSWKEDIDIWGDSYQESGVVILASSEYRAYVDEAYTNDIEQGLRVKVLESGAALQTAFPSGAEVGSFEAQKGYLNFDGGWADAGKATALLTKKVESLGAKLMPGKSVSELIRKDGTVVGVRCSDDTVLEASLVVLATGSWTPSAFPDLSIGSKCVATGQCVAMVQLSEEEAARYREVPVYLNFGTGFYCFPPTSNNVVKMAIHAPGFTHTVEDISTPRTVITNPENGLAIPKSALRQLREHFKEVFPELAKKPFLSTRLCWYNDSPDGDWIIGRHPEYNSVVIATAGSGHAFKFLPVIGRLVADAIQGTLETHLVQKFAFDRKTTHLDGSRPDLVNQRQELVIDQLCEEQDLYS